MASSIRRIWVNFLLLFWAVTATAGPVTPREIQHYINIGNPEKALQLLAPVLQRSPGSAKAWYLAAEANNAAGNNTVARTDLMRAEKLSPRMPFVRPHDLKLLEQRLGVVNPLQAQEAATRTKIIIGLVLLLLMGVVMSLFFMRRKRNKESSALYKSVQNLRAQIVDFMSSDINPDKIAATARDDEKRLRQIATVSLQLIQYLNELKNDFTLAKIEESYSTAEARYQEIEAQVRSLFKGYHDPNFEPAPDAELVRMTQSLTGNDASNKDLLDSFPQASGNASLNPTNTPPVTPPASGNPTPTAYAAPAPQEVYIRSGGDPLFQGLEQGIGMGLGMGMGEEIAGGIMGNNSSWMGGEGMNASDSNPSVLDAGYDSGYTDSGTVGGADDGLQGDSNSFASGSGSLSSGSGGFGSGGMGSGSSGGFSSNS